MIVLFVTMWDNFPPSEISHSSSNWQIIVAVTVSAGAVVILAIIAVPLVIIIIRKCRRHPVRKQEGMMISYMHEHMVPLDVQCILLCVFALFFKFQNVTCKI